MQPDQIPSQPPVSRRSFPLSTPLLFLFALAAMYTIGLSVLAFRAVIPQLEKSRGLWTLLFSLILTWWVYDERRSRGFKLPFEFECFVFFAWPVTVPHYLYRRIGGRGVLIGLGVLVLYFVPFVIAAFVYAGEQVFGSH